MTPRTPPRITVAEHPLLCVAPFITRFQAPLGELVTPPAILERLRVGADTPLSPSDTVRSEVRDLLRWGGHRPSGIGKPASEYLVRAAEQGTLGPINLAVDICNVVSLHSGFPIGVADTELARPPYRIAVAPRGSTYVFNPSGQEMSLGGLLCLYDREGPCINPVRDSQRTKTRPETVETLSVVWAPISLQERLREAERWYRGMLEEVGAATETVTVASEATAEGAAPGVDNAAPPPAESS